MNTSPAPEPNPNWRIHTPASADVALALIMTSRMRTLDEWGRRARHPQGRPQPRTVQGSIASLLVSLMTTHHAQVTVVDAVQQGMSRAVQDALGITAHPAPVLKRKGDRGISRRYSKPHEGLGRHLDSLNRQLEASPFFGWYLNDEQRAENYAFQHLVSDDIVAGWVPPLPAPDLLSIDTTSIRNFTGWKDPDFAPVYQTPTHLDPQETIHGAHGNSMVGANLPGHMPYPDLTLAFRLPLLTENPHLDLVALELIDSWLARGNPPAPVVTDSYYTNKTDWSLNLARRGCGMIGDLQELDRGPKGHVQGAALIDGCLHCPFGRYRRDLPSPKQKGRALAEYRSANQYRARFACQVVAETPTDIVLVCPAQAGLVRCRRWSDSMKLGDLFPEVEDGPAEDAPVVPAVCGGPIRVPRTTRWIRKIWMPVYFGSDEWRTNFVAGRPRTEETFGYVFGPTTLQATFGVTSWVGQARTGLVYALAFAVENLRQIRAWWVSTSARDLLPASYRDQLENDPLLWRVERLEALLPTLLTQMKREVGRP